MTVAIKPPIRMLDDDYLPSSFNRLLRVLRIRAGMSQNQLARGAGVDPAYVNRLERATDDSEKMPTRRVVLGLAEALDASPDVRDQLLVAAGLCPQVIVEAGGWDRYTTNVREAVRLPLLDLLDNLRDAMHSPSPQP